MGGTTISNRKLLLKRFHALHDYIRVLGIHINQLHTRLEQIEKKIIETKTNHRALIEVNKTELGNLKTIMVTIHEVDTLLDELNSSIMGLLPPLPVSKSTKEAPPLEEKYVEQDTENNGRQREGWEDVEEAETEEEPETQKELETEEKEKKKKFPFIPRFRVIVHKRKK